MIAKKAPLGGNIESVAYCACFGHFSEDICLYTAAWDEERFQVIIIIMQSTP